ncbi:hypothetical protein [Clostridium paraputrificum]|uniref:hypothetical protein n=1 Tax=Clostridium paraputrificum TaxID=29363 RepID=UPI0018A0C139|nr:hypothetical protein [Clostridium paraputrificum]
MKSKRKIFIVAITFIFVIILTLCGSKTQLNSEKISSIRIQALPSPPKFKDIDKKCYKIDDKVLNEFRELYNSLQYEEKSYNQW